MGSKARAFISENPVFFRWCFGIAFATSLSLFVGGFFVPPMGQIDGSVLKAGGILLAFGVAAMLPEILRSGRQATFKHGDTSVTLSAGTAQPQTDSQLGAIEIE